jgi:hypothetical protein
MAWSSKGLGKNPAPDLGFPLQQESWDKLPKRMRVLFSGSPDAIPMEDRILGSRTQSHQPMDKVTTSLGIYNRYSSRSLIEANNMKHLFF